jgi:hypothetical protein
MKGGHIMERGTLKRRLLKIAIWVAGAFALFTIIGFLVLPPVAKSVLVTQLSKALHRDVSIEKIKMNPYTLAFSMKGLVIKERGKQETFVSLGELSTALSAKSIFKRAPIIKRLSIVRPYIRAIRNPDETFNFTDIMTSTEPKKPEPKPAKEAKPFQFSVNNIVISEGHIDFFDGPKNIHHTIKDLNVAVPFVSNMKEWVHIYEQPRFSANINGDIYTLQGKTKPFEESLESFLDVTIKGLEIPRYMSYVPVKTNFVLNSGTVDVAAKISFKRAPDKTQSCTVTGDVAIKNIAMDDLGKNPLVRLGSCEIALGTIQPFTPTAHLAKISLKGLEINAKRDKSGQINFASLVGEEAKEPREGKDKKTAVAKKTAAQKATPKAEKSPLPDVKLDEFQIEQGTVSFRDQLPGEPADLKITDFTMKAGNLSTAKNSTSDLSLTLVLNKTGTVSIKGPVGIDPLSANLTVAVKGIGIRPFQPYFTDKVKIAVTKGQVQTTGTLVVALDKNEEPTVKFTGAVLVSGFASLDKESGDDLLKWKALSFTSIKAGFNPVYAHITGISLADFYAGLAVQQDGTLNLRKIFVEEDGAEKESAKKQGGPGSPAKEAAAAKKPAGTGKAKPENISIGAITLQGGTIDFFDKSIKPRYTANLTEIGGRVAGFSLNENKNADVEVRGKINKSIPLEIMGSINPTKDNLFADLKVKFNDLDLSDMSPYSGKYIGYKIEKGKLSMDLKYLIKKRNLDSQNIIFIDQLTLGEKVESKDALKLPIGLAIALLKDRNGRITLDVPVSGSLDDPKFSVWSIVIKVIVNLITKAATAPFALLGALVGGGGEELSYVEFDYGSSRLSEANLKKIDSLVKALSDRPQLKLDIEGRVDADKDREALKTYFFQRKVKVQKMNVLIKKGETIENADDVKIEPGEYEQYLTRAYKAETFAKPRNVLGFAKSLPVPEMEKLMLTHTEVTDGDLRNLANQRALHAKDAILKSGQVSTDRVFMLEPKTQPSEKKGKLTDSRVDFKLK